MYKFIFKYIKYAIQHHALYHSRYVYLFRVGHYNELGVTKFSELIQ